MLSKTQQCRHYAVGITTMFSDAGFLNSANTKLCRLFFSGGLQFRASGALLVRGECHGAPSLRPGNTILSGANLSPRGCVNHGCWPPALVSRNLFERNLHFRVDIGFRTNTEWMECMSHRKRRETKQQPNMLPSPAVPGCCIVSFHFLCDIHSIHSVLFV